MGCKSAASSFGKNVVLMRAWSPEDQNSSSIGTNGEFSLSPAISAWGYSSSEELYQWERMVQGKLFAIFGSPPADEWSPLLS